MIDAALTLVGPDGPMRGGADRGVPNPRGGEGIAVLDVRHTLISPRDVVTGEVTGKRRHAPIVVTKDVDRATPQLLHVWARNDVLTTWRLDVFGADAFGRRVLRYTIELGRAHVVEVALLTPEEVTFPRESVSFAYEQITWTWAEGKVSSTDDWLTAQ